MIWTDDKGQLVDSDISDCVWYSLMGDNCRSWMMTPLLIRGIFFKVPTYDYYRVSLGKLYRIGDQRHWTHEINNGFAKKFMQNIEKTLSGWSETSKYTPLCAAGKYTLHFDRQLLLSELRDPTNKCQLCELLHHCLYSLYGKTEDSWHTIRYGSDLTISRNKHVLHPLFDPGPPIRLTAKFQVGVPNLHSMEYSVSGNPLYFQLLCQCLQECDGHPGCVKQTRDWPKRVCSLEIQMPTC